MVTKLLKEAEPWIVGLWRFREAGKPTMWCATYVVHGKYYDVTQRRTPATALRVLIQTARKLEARGYDNGI